MPAVASEYALLSFQFRISVERQILWIWLPHIICQATQDLYSFVCCWHTSNCGIINLTCSLFCFPVKEHVYSVGFPQIMLLLRAHIGYGHCAGMATRLDVKQHINTGNHLYWLLKILPFSPGQNKKQ